MSQEFVLNFQLIWSRNNNNQKEKGKNTGNHDIKILSIQYSYFFFFEERPGVKELVFTSVDT